MMAEIFTRTSHKNISESESEVKRPGLRLITFLGKGRYEEVRYIWSGEEGIPMAYQTRFVPEAIVYFLEAPGKLEIKEVLVLVTEEVKQGYNLEELQKRLPDKLKVKEIPEGRTETDLWNIFNEIVSELKRKEEEIVLDITHGFRSIPMIVFSVADYLRKIESVTIRYILYGAYDAGAYCSDGIKSVPVFDLTPLLDLMEWAGGLEAFLKKGEANLIGEKIEEKHQSLRSKGGSSEDLPKRLKSVGKKLKKLSNSLHLARAKEVLEDAHDLLGLLKEAKDELENWIKPFAIILDRVETEVKEFAYKESDKLNPDNLKKQLALIRYYHKKGLFLQATLLIREWIVSYVILNHFPDKHEEWTKVESREKIEGFLNMLNKVSEFWNEVGGLRNDLAHCGMRENPIGSDKIKSKVEEIANKLEELFKNNSAGAKSR